MEQALKDALQPSLRVRIDVASFLIDIGEAISSHEAPNNQMVKLQQKWLPYHVPEGNTFNGTIYYVDHDGTICLVPDENVERLQMLEGDINKFCDALPLRHHDQYWMKNYPCFVQWDWDGRWYRGQLEEICNENCKVKLIDYGTEIISPKTKLRKDIFTTEIPSQMIRLKLEGIVPNSRDEVNWSPEVIYKIHEEFVTKRVEVELIGSKDERPLVADINKEEGGKLSEFLIYTGLAKKKPSENID